jgi:MscS family membrane protein
MAARRPAAFPALPGRNAGRLSGTLHYPPRGSPDFNATEEEQAAGDERLSAEPQQRPEAAQPPAAMAGEKERS